MLQDVTSHIVIIIHDALLPCFSAYVPLLVLCPTLCTCEGGLVFCATPLVTRGRTDFGFEITNQIAADLVIFT